MTCKKQGKLTKNPGKYLGFDLKNLVA